MDARLLDVLHHRADVDGDAVAERVDVDLERAFEEAVDEDGAGDARHRRAHLPLVVADPHRAAAEDVRGPDEHRVADPLRDLDRGVRRVGDPPLRAPDPELREQLPEPFAVLGEVDRLVGRPEHLEPGRLDRPRQLQRRLAAELDHDTFRPLPLADREHVLDVEGLEVEPVGRVVVRRDRLRVAVDHDRLVAERAEALRRVDAAVVELDPLADPVRAGAEDDDARLATRGHGLVRLAPSRVVVVRVGGHLARAGVDAAVDALALRRPLLAQLLELAPEPRVEVVGQVVEARPRRVCARVELAARPRLPERLLERAPDPHRLADRLHLRAERRIGAGELLEREARELDDDVVERRLEARRRRLRQVVRDLVERVADGELGRDLGDRVARRLRRERRGAGDARVHLDHADLARLTVAGELDVRAAGLDADRADDGDRGVAELLVGLVGEGQLRRDRDRVAGVDAHRVEVLDRADDDDVVAAVADHLELELVPALDRLLDEHLADRALAQAALDLCAQLRGRRDEAAAVTAEREGGPHHGRDRDAGEVVDTRDDP